MAQVIYAIIVVKEVAIVATWMDSSKVFCLDRNIS